MAAFSRGLYDFLPKRTIFGGTNRSLSTITTLRSGHNRWSKIKHEKGAADAKKNRVRSSMAGELTLASKLYGSDPNMNPRLATLIANAKKAGFPKASMEAAIARGQGQSATGNKLENLTLEVIMPPSIALIIECETDSKARTLMDIRFKIKCHGGTVTPTSYLFDRKGKLVFEKSQTINGIDDVLDAAIEAGAEDVDTNEEDGIIVWTDPTKTFSTLQELQKILDLKVKSSEIIWDAKKDTLVPLIDVDILKMNRLLDLVETLQEDPDVQGVFANVAKGNLSDERWAELRSNLDA
ncbi:putative transcriptional regulatory protein [Golovinomyces cichoracearum]|uniref:Putative transcriptional regulatory protein n=1 Tax=Golovinomyces cichoracearum TaxID=62708 RepID=A0A420J8Y2_9PEZI|nr:putative transcriptional regulatory protein [Golovinomyces cichoracearum]